MATQIVLLLCKLSFILAISGIQINSPELTNDGPTDLLVVSHGESQNIASTDQLKDNQLIKQSEMLRHKRNTADRNFVRLGRNSDGYERKSDKNFVRFGRNDSPAKNNAFIRFGRSDKSFVRFGRDENDAVRFGRRGDKFIRFGRSGGGAKDTTLSINDLAKLSHNRDMFTDDSNVDNLNSNSILKTIDGPLSRIGRNGNFVRFGRPDHAFVRLGKKKSTTDAVTGNERKSTTDDNEDNSNEYTNAAEIIDEPLFSAGKAQAQTNNLKELEDNREKLYSILEADYL